MKQWISRRAPWIMGLGLGLILMSSLLWYWFYHSGQFPLRKIDVWASGVHCSAAEIKAIVAPQITQGLLAVNVQTLRQTLLDCPWVESASVARIWPDRLKIIVKEKQIVAQWENLGLITDKGELFNPPQLDNDPKRPQLSGPAESRVEIIQVFSKLRTMLAKHDLGLKKLQLSSSHAWTLRLDNGIDVQIGHNDPVQLMRRWLKVYDKTLKPCAATVASVDLRYPSGMAVRWRADNS